MFRKKEEMKKPYHPITSFYDMMNASESGKRSLRRAEKSLLNNAIMLNDIKYAVSLLETETNERKQSKLKGKVHINQDYTSDRKKRTPLHLAASCDHVQCHKTSGARVKLIMLLIQEGVDPNEQDMFGNTPLHNILRVKSKDEACPVVGTLIRETNLDIKNNQGHTALHLAIMNNYDGLAKALITEDTDLLSKDKNGKNIFDLILKNDKKMLHDTCMVRSESYREYFAKGIFEIRYPNTHVPKDSMFLYHAIMHSDEWVANLFITSYSDFTTIYENGKNVFMLVEEGGKKDLHNAFMERSDAYRKHYINSCTEKKGFIPLQHLIKKQEMKDDQCHIISESINPLLPRKAPGFFVSSVKGKPHPLATEHEAIVSEKSSANSLVIMSPPKSRKRKKIQEENVPMYSSMEGITEESDLDRLSIEMFSLFPFKGKDCMNTSHTENAKRRKESHTSFNRS